MGIRSPLGYLDDPILEFHEHLQRRYDIGLGDYDDMWKAQGGVCKICGQAEKKRRLAVDHDHETGKIRGLLCTNCNMGLGHFKDNPKLLDLAAQYSRDANTAPS